ncbi:MAG: type restriction protein res subunit [Hyphomicrobiales bacterium]|nr:type restriction protein res subunit [Hyphomicrobiales bacterium]
MIELRPYQAAGVAEIRAHFSAGRRRVVYVLPTGGGKTICFSFVAASVVDRAKSVLLLGHRDEIVRQISGALSALGVEHGVIAAGHPLRPGPVQVASVATLARRLGPDLPKFDLVVIDEAHHAVAGIWRKIQAALPDAFVLGVTATPERLDGRGLASTFDAMVQGPTVTELTAGGFLSPFRLYAPAEPVDLSAVKAKAGDFEAGQLARAMSRPVIIGSAVDGWERICLGVPTVAFCVDRAHSQLVAERFRARGHRAVHIDGETPPTQRRAAIEALRTGDIDVLCNCGLISEGVDVPAIGAALLLRPTQSLAMYLQQVGRALRVSPGKERAHILDFAGNVWRHGAPDAPRAWSLDSKRRKAPATAPQSNFRRCQACSALSQRRSRGCTACGAEIAMTPAERAEIEAELVAAERLRIMDEVRGLPYSAQLAWAGADEHRLRIIASVRGYKPGWAWHRLQELAETAES